MSALAAVRRARPLNALGFPAFRRLWGAALILAFGSWMERLTIGWLVLDVTDSVFLTGLSFAVQTAPNMLLGPIAGALADRIERRLLLALATLIRALLLVAIGAVVVADLRVVWAIFIVLAIAGAARTFEPPATQALITDIVGVFNSANAVGLHSLGVRSVGVLGALSGGVLIERFGAGPPLLAAAGLLAVGAWVLSTISVERKSSRTGGSSLLADALEGLRVMAGIPVVAALLVLTLAVEIFAFSYNSLMPAVAKQVLSVGPTGLGALTLAVGIGSIAGSAALSQLGYVRRRGRILLAVTLGYGAFLIAFASADRLPIALLLVAGVGAMAAMFDGLQWILLQANVPDAMRGRVIGGWIWAIGFGWVGPIALGAVGEALGVPFALAGSGAIVIVLAFGAVLLVPGLRRA